MGFRSVQGSVCVRFACLKGFVETDGRVVSDTEVSLLTPSFEKFGPVEVRHHAVRSGLFFPSSCDVSPRVLPGKVGTVAMMSEGLSFPQ